MSGPHKHESNKAPVRDGLTSSSREGAVMALELRVNQGTGRGRSMREQKSLPLSDKRSTDDDRLYPGRAV